MRKRLIFISIAACIGLGVTSCKDKEDNNLEFAEYTVEENKENIEAEGLKVIDQMEDMKNLSSISTIQDFLNLSMRMNESSYSLAYKRVANILTPVSGMKINLMELANLRSSTALVEDEFSMKDYLRTFGGTYTYNSSVDTFAYVKNSNEITFKFPIGQSSTNNGKITLNNFSSQFASNADFEGMEQLKSLDLNVWNGDSRILSIEMDATYNENDLPSSESIRILLEKGYSFSETFSYNEKDIKWDFSFLKDKNNIFNGAFDTNGNYSYDNISNLNNESFQSPELISDILKSANASIQLGNLKLSGAINFEQLSKDYYKDFSNDNEELTKAKSDIACTILNNNSFLVLMYADKREAIAKLVFNTVENEYYQYPYESEKMSSYFSPTPSFVFSDGSAMDGSFFGTGFNDFNNALDVFMNELNK